MTVVIKNVSDEHWRLFKSEAAKQGMNLGAFFDLLVDEHFQYKSEAERSWKTIFQNKPFLTAKDAGIIEESSTDIRKKYKIKRK